MTISTNAAWCGALVGLACLAACDGGSLPSTALCDTTVEVSVTGTAAPQFSWSPACQVEQLVVLEPVAPSVGQPQVRWAVAGSGGMSPPIRYGQTPLGASALQSADPLVAGHHYVVRLSMSEIVGSSTVVGEAGFTR